MNISLSTYLVKKGDSLESVAEQIGISPETLKRYHNTYSDLQNLIGHDLEGIPEIILPPKEKIEELQKSDKEKSKQCNLPLYITENFYYHKYTCTEFVRRIDEEPINFEYKSYLDIEKNPSNGFLASLHLKDFITNGQTPDNKISMISIATMDSISPITFTVPAQGCISDVYDHEEIVKKFENKRDDLEDFFIGEASKKYFQKFYDSIRNKQFLLNQFKSRLLFQTLFLKTSWLHTQSEWEEYVSIKQNSFPVRCLFTKKINDEHEDYTEISIIGKIQDNCSLQEVLKGVRYEVSSEENINGVIHLVYKITKDIKRLAEFSASITLYYEDEVYLEHHLNAKAN